jgi:hypothetical protein
MVWKNARERSDGSSATDSGADRCLEPKVATVLRGTRRQVSGQMALSLATES